MRRFTPIFPLVPEPGPPVFPTAGHPSPPGAFSISRTLRFDALVTFIDHDTDEIAAPGISRFASGCDELGTIFGVQRFTSAVKKTVKGR